MPRPVGARRFAAAGNVVQKADTLVGFGHQLTVHRLAEIFAPGADPAVVGRADQVQQATGAGALGHLLPQCLEALTLGGGERPVETAHADPAARSGHAHGEGSRDRAPARPAPERLP